MLVPTAKLRDAGFSHGFVGVEIKASGVNIGPAISQALDYSRSVWRLPGGYDCMARYYFLFPAKAQGGIAASVMAQNRLGTAESTWPDREYHQLRFKCGEQLFLRYHFETDQIEIGKLNFGNRTGSR